MGRGRLRRGYSLEVIFDKDPDFCSHLVSTLMNTVSLIGLCLAYKVLTTSRNRLTAHLWELTFSIPSAYSGQLENLRLWKFLQNINRLTALLVFELTEGLKKPTISY